MNWQKLYVPLIGAIVTVILIVQPPFLFTASVVKQNNMGSESGKDVIMGYIHVISGGLMQSLIILVFNLRGRYPFIC